MQLSPGNVARDLWILFGLWWLISALRRKPTKKRESWTQRLGYVLLLIVAFCLLAEPVAERGWLAIQLIPWTLGWGWFGCALVALGVAIAFWARWHLGANWSGTVTLKEGHELIATGPYRFIRHPIYTGILLAMLGSVLQLGQVRGFLAILIACVSFYIKAKREESFLTSEFGDRFVARVEHTGMFLPKFS
jgi:protein-S-isoprenylcysteine O-methyltransferase Ste14